MSTVSNTPAVPVSFVEYDKGRKPTRFSRGHDPMRHIKVRCPHCHGLHIHGLEASNPPEFPVTHRIADCGGSFKGYFVIYPPEDFTPEFSPEDEEQHQFTTAVEAAWGSTPWLAAEATEAARRWDQLLPGDMPEHVLRLLPFPSTENEVNRRLGRWLSRRQGIWVGGMRIRKGEPCSRARSNSWWIEKEDRP